MAFYGIVGLFSSFYFGSIICWDIGGGFDIFNKKKGKRYVLFVGDFLKKNRRIILEIPMSELHYIR